jgi:hypothetical protein
MLKIYPARLPNGLLPVEYILEPFSDFYRWITHRKQAVALSTKQ